MGHVICPNGSSVYTDKVDKSVLYEYVVRDIKDDKRTVSCRARNIMLLGDLNVWSSHAGKFLPYLRWLLDNTDSELLIAAARYTLTKFASGRSQYLVKATCDETYK